MSHHHHHHHHHPVSPTPVQTFKVPSTHHHNRIRGLLELPNETILSWSADNSIKRWSLTDGRIVSYVGHTAGVTSVIVWAIISGSYDDTLMVWDVASGRRLGVFAFALGPLSMTRLKKGRSSHPSWFTVGCANGKIALCRFLVRTKAVEWAWISDGHSHEVTSMYELSDGTSVSGARYGDIKRWKVTFFTQTCLQHLRGGHSHTITQLIQLRSSGLLLSCDSKDTLCVWNQTSEKPLAVVQNSFASSGIIEVEDDVLISAGGDCVQVWKDMKCCCSASAPASTDDKLRFEKAIVSQAIRPIAAIVHLQSGLLMCSTCNSTEYQYIELFKTWKVYVHHLITYRYRCVSIDDLFRYESLTFLFLMKEIPIGYVHVEHNYKAEDGEQTPNAPRTHSRRSICNVLSVSSSPELIELQVILLTMVTSCSAYSFTFNLTTFRTIEAVYSTLPLLTHRTSLLMSFRQSWLQISNKLVRLIWA